MEGRTVPELAPVPAVPTPEEAAVADALNPEGVMPMVPLTERVGKEEVSTDAVEETVLVVTDVAVGARADTTAETEEVE